MARQNSVSEERGCRLTPTMVAQGPTLTLAMTSGSGSSRGSAHSTVTRFPQTFTLPLISRRRAWAAVLWSSYSKKQKPRFFFLSTGWRYNMTSFRPSVETAEKTGQFQEFKSHFHSDIPFELNYKIILSQWFDAFSVRSDLSGKLSWWNWSLQHSNEVIIRTQTEQDLLIDFFTKSELLLTHLWPLRTPQ